jgi:hypothetical protein
MLVGISRSRRGEQIMGRPTFNAMMVLCAAVVFGLTGCGGGGGGGGIATSNNVTAAKAGVAQNVAVGSSVTLDGSQSTCTDGGLITYHWIIVSKPVGSAASLYTPNAVNPSISIDLSGQYVVKLIVTDSKAVTSEDTVIITALVANASPVANAGTPQSVIAGSVVTLDGSASSDANGDLLTYRWVFTSKPNGSSTTLSNATVVNPTFTPDVVGTYIFNLVVNDGKVSSIASAVSVSALTNNGSITVGW